MLISSSEMLLNIPLLLLLLIFPNKSVLCEDPESNRTHVNIPAKLFDWSVTEVASFSGDCSIWWPLHNSEIFSYVLSGFGSEIFDVHISCFSVKSYSGSIEINNKFYEIPKFTPKNYFNHEIFSVVADHSEKYNFRVILHEVGNNSSPTKESSEFLFTIYLVNNTSHLNSTSIPPLYVQAQRMMSSRTRADFGHLLNYLKLDGVAAEIGVHKGYFAKEMLSIWNGSLYLLIDPWQSTKFASYCVEVEECESIMEEAKSRLSIFGERAYFLRKFSIDAARIIADNSLDFVYIDGLHDYYNVMLDMMAWWPKVRKGGVMAGHDFNQIPLFHAVTEFARKLHLSVFSTVTFDKPAPSWYIFKL